MQTAQHWVLPKEPTSPASAREHVAGACAGMSRDLLEIALLLTSELVTNAVKYGGEHILLVLRDERDIVRVEVHDDGAQSPRLGAPSHAATGGRGLLLLESLSSEWGTSPHGPGETGKVVWFSLRRAF